MKNIRAGTCNSVARNELGKTRSVCTPWVPFHREPAPINDDRLVEKLACTVLEWRAVSGRYLKPNRSWSPCWKFQPMNNVDDAFNLLDTARAQYSLSVGADGTFTAEVEVAGRIGKASCSPKARAICLALAQALGLVMDERSLSAGSRKRKEP
jgi:hypothetical protein